MDANAPIVQSLTRNAISNNNEIISNIYYSYDSKGNTTYREEFPIYEGTISELGISTIEMEYDDKNNSRYNWNLPADIIQYNNPTLHHEENMFMCMMPPNFQYEYDYNSAGYPITQFRKEIYTEIVDTFYYEYLK